ncbi:hypothetical protein KWG_0110540 [Xanthomonas vasicola pv. vasculorum NCPPB 1381]|nr:hypothetical protein KWG_0110540 [Xanthomonas vasicola pv. vasculorum NCPPB 1381]
MLRATQCSADERAALFMVVAVEDGHEHEIYLVQQIVFAALAISRSNTSPASLPSISPPRMPACASTTGFPRLPLCAHKQVAPFAGLAEHLQRQQRRNSNQTLQPRTRFVVAGRADEIAAFTGVLHGSAGATIKDSLAPCHARTGARRAGIDGLGVKLCGGEHRCSEQAGDASGTGRCVAGTCVGGGVRVACVESVVRENVAESKFMWGVNVSNGDSC